jgi:hypothetical protein
MFFDDDNYDALGLPNKCVETDWDVYAPTDHEKARAVPYRDRDYIRTYDIPRDPEAGLPRVRDRLPPVQPYMCDDARLRELDPGLRPDAATFHVPVRQGGTEDMRVPVPTIDELRGPAGPQVSYTLGVIPGAPRVKLSTCAGTHAVRGHHHSADEAMGLVRAVPTTGGAVANVDHRRPDFENRDTGRVMRALPGTAGQGHWGSVVPGAYQSVAARPHEEVRWGDYGGPLAGAPMSYVQAYDDPAATTRDQASRGPGAPHLGPVLRDPGLRPDPDGLRRTQRDQAAEYAYAGLAAGAGAAPAAVRPGATRATGRETVAEAASSVGGDVVGVAGAWQPLVATQAAPDANQREASALWSSRPATLASGVTTGYAAAPDAPGDTLRQATAIRVYAGAPEPLDHAPAVARDHAPGTTLRQATAIRAYAGAPEPLGSVAGAATLPDARATLREQQPAGVAPAAPVRGPRGGWLRLEEAPRPNQRQVGGDAWGTGELRGPAGVDAYVPGRVNLRSTTRATMAPRVQAGAAAGPEASYVDGLVSAPATGREQTGARATYRGGAGLATLAAHPGAAAATPATTRETLATPSTGAASHALGASGDAAYTIAHYDAPMTERTQTTVAYAHNPGTRHASETRDAAFASTVSRNMDAVTTCYVPLGARPTTDFHPGTLQQKNARATYAHRTPLPQVQRRAGDLEDP